MNAPRGAPGPWAPLAQPAFRAMWLAVLASNVGTWVHDVAAAWMMTEATGSPLMVALVQAATTVPVVLLALVAGALADVVDRRRYLIAAQLWMMFVATLLALLAHLGRLDPWVLLALTFALGVGAAMAMPAQAATTPELVPRADMPAAVALGSLGMNVARAIGPALGGLVIAQAGAAWAFGLNALSFLGLLLVLARWRRAAPPTVLPPEPFGSALRAGLRYAASASVLQAVLVRAAAFFLFASALSALLPIVVREELGAGAAAYGLLLGCFGGGAILGALALPALRRRAARDTLVAGATGAFAACLLALAWLGALPLALVTMAVAGAAWIAVLSSLQVAVQSSVPQWVRARALALYIVVFSGGMAVGSLAWGAVAQASSLDASLVAAAVGLVAAALLARRFSLAGAEEHDLTPSGHWPAPELVEPVAHDRGPVLVTLEYEVAPADLPAFLAAMQELGASRRRDGALQWALVADAGRKDTYLEYFVTASWLDHLRQHERVTEDDRRLQTAVRALHRGPAAPRVRHFVGGIEASGPTPAGPPTHGEELR